MILLAAAVLCCGGVAWDWLAVDFDPIQARTACASVSGATHQVSEADLLDSAEVWIVDPVAVTGFDDLIDVQTTPAHIHELNFRHDPGRGHGRGLIADEPGSVREFDDGVEVTKTADAGSPTDGGRAAQIDVVVLVSDGDGAGGGTKQRHRVGHVVVGLI